MASGDGCQALCGPFSHNDLPSFQAAIEHLESQWREPLPTLAGRIVYAAISITSKFNRPFCRLSARFLRRGLKRNPVTGFSGLAAFTETEQALNAALNLLHTIGVFKQDIRGRTTIDYSVTAIDLVQHDDIVKSVKRRYSHNPYMRTVEGILAWAEKLTSWLLPANEKSKPPTGSTTSESSKQECVSGDASPNPRCESLSTAPRERKDCNSAGTLSATRCAPATTSVCGPAMANTNGPLLWKKPNGNQCLGSPESYSFSYRATLFSGDKSPSNVWARFMGKAEELKAAILAGVADRSNRLHQKRAKRGNIADLCNIFEDAWRKGQHERDRSVLASRLVARDRKLLKDQIVYPARELDMDINAFAHWVALHWDAIGATYFQKAKAYPKAPAFRWLVRCLETYTTAFQHRDSLDPTGKLPDAQRVSTEALAALSDRAGKAISAANSDVDDLRRQLAEARDENRKLRSTKGLKADDDPVYNRVIKQASRKITIGSYDDEPAPRKLRRPRK